jgi:ABC-type ATPase with predicted acetyltransferase domain
MNYSDCEVKAYLFKKDEPLISKVEIDDLTNVAQECFDYEFDGESNFFPYELPEFLKKEKFQTLVITGASGKGKSTLLKEFDFYNKKLKKFDNSKAIISNFKDKDDASDRLSSVGLSSVPVWVKPRNVLSIGEGFRADLALNIDSETIFDEFTSTIDRTVAISTVNSIKKYIKKHNLSKVVFCSCHKDYIDYLEPDYVIDLDLEKVFDCRNKQLKKVLSCQCGRSLTTQEKMTSGKYLGNIII